MAHTIYGPGGFDSTKPNNNVIAVEPEVPDPLAGAKATVAALLAQQGTLQSQLEADIASVANWGTLTAAEQGAIIGRILQDGLGSAMQAILAQLQLSGHAPS